MIENKWYNGLFMSKKELMERYFQSFPTLESRIKNNTRKLN